MPAYYNEWDQKAAAKLRGLIARGLIAPGEVDTRSVEDVRPDDLKGFTQIHLFAGIGGWSLALRYASWADDRPVWTASCPCQPYSAASVGHGGAKGQSDERDLWPVLPPLIREFSPSTIFGEQVGKAIGWGWWDRAAMDLEGQAYAVAAAILRAEAYEGEHERQRLYWLAHAGRKGREGHKPLQRLPVAAQAALPEYGDTVARTRRALDGDYNDLLPCDGLSVAVEREAVKQYGNALHIGTAVAFIQAADAILSTLKG